jgi:hypothetical protein
MMIGLVFEHEHGTADFDGRVGQAFEAPRDSSCADDFEALRARSPRNRRILVHSDFELQQLIDAWR